MELAAKAEALDRSLRSLRTWKHLAPEESVAPPGRPPTSEEELVEAKDLVHEQLELQGWETGEEPIHRALGEAVPRARVRRVLRELKRERRARIRCQETERRVSMHVLARDVIWSMDATHLGRAKDGGAVQGEVVREVASTRTVGLSVGPPARGYEVVELLDQVVQERGGAPLVLLNDNGGAYRSVEVTTWCERHGVLHLFSLPRTPQHNAASEHGMRGLKLGSGLDDGRAVIDIDEACEALELARDRIDRHRLRRTRGWMTAMEADRVMPHWSASVTREQVLEKASCALEEALLHCQGKRARRRAAREAILGTLQHFSVIQRTRGGRPWTAHIAEGET